MRSNTRFTVAIHMLALIELNKTQPSTSDLMALSVGTNPVVIRQLMTALKKAGLIESQVGVPGSRLAKPQEEITLLDIYRAVQKRSNACLFDFHPTPNPMCPIGRNIEDNELILKRIDYKVDIKLTDTEMKIFKQLKDKHYTKYKYMSSKVDYETSVHLDNKNRTNKHKFVFEV